MFAGLSLDLPARAREFHLVHLVSQQLQEDFDEYHSVFLHFGQHVGTNTVRSQCLAIADSIWVIDSSAGLVIMVGDRRTRKRDILEKKLIQAITQEAIERKGMERRVAQRHMEQEERKAAEGLRELKTQATSNEVEDSITPTTDEFPSYTPASSEPLAHDSRP